MHNKILSIIVPVYKVEQYIRKCLDSICSLPIFKAGQIELIVVNDGTPDHSMTIVEEYKNVYPDIIIINQQNQGLSIARNNGLDIAKGEYIWFVDSDDVVLDKDLESVISDLLNTKPDIYTTQLCRFNEETEIKEIDKYNKYMNPYTIIRGSDYLFDEGRLGPVQQYLYRRTFLTDNKLLFEPGVYHEDGDFCLRTFYMANRVYISDKVIYQYFYRAGSIMQSIKMKNLKDLTHLYKKNIEFGEVHVRPEDKKYWKATIAGLMIVQLGWSKRLSNQDEFAAYYVENISLFRKAALHKLLSKRFHKSYLKTALLLLFNKKFFITTK